MKLEGGGREFEGLGVEREGWGKGGKGFMVSMGKVGMGEGGGE